jgi:hypothetical protein
MAAGQGFKTFTTGEVLTAGDVNGYLMQGINVFTNATARDAAITAPAEGQFAFTKDNNSLWYYDGATWVASGATGDIEGVTVTSPLTGGGTSGTVTVGILSGTTSNLGAVQLSDSISSTSTTLAATANAVKTTYDLANGAIPKSTVTTNGDLIYGTGSATVTRRAIGTTGQVLTVSGGVPTWATPAGSAQSFTQLSSASVGTGSTYTVSGLSGYNQLFFSLRNVSCDAAGYITIRLNSDSGTNYEYNGLGLYTNSSSTLATQQINNNSANIINWCLPNAAANSGSGSFYIQGANSTGVKVWQSMGSVGGSGDRTTYVLNGVYTGTSAISSITIGADGNNFDAGTLVIWGAA